LPVQADLFILREILFLRGFRIATKTVFDLPAEASAQAGVVVDD
jgi:hypothetical protein